MAYSSVTRRFTDGLPTLGASDLNDALANLNGDASAAQAVVAGISSQVRLLSDRFRDVIRLEDFLPSANNDVGLALNNAHSIAQPGDRITLRGAGSYLWSTPATLSKAGVSFQTGATFEVVGGITAVTLAGTGNTLRDATFLGAVQTQAGIAAGSCAVSVPGVCCLAENIVPQWLDNLITVPLGAGYCSTIRGIDARFAGSRVVWIEDGVGTTIEDLIYDSSFPTAVAGLHYQSQGCYIHNVDLLHCGGQAALLIEPYAGGANPHGLYWTFFNTVELDSSVTVPGILIRNVTPASGAGSLQLTGMFFTACWSSTNQYGLVTGGTGPIDLITLTGCQLFNNALSAIYNTAGADLIVEASTIAGNCNNGATPSPTIHHNGGGLLSIRGGRIAAAGLAVNQGNPTTHIQRDAGAGQVVIDGCSMDVPTGSNWTGSPVSPGSDSAGKVHIGNVLGFNTKNSGSVAVPSGASSVTFAHGLSLTPGGSAFQLTPLGPPSGMTGYYLDQSSITATQATIRILGTTTAAVVFAWRVAVDVL